jgi:hypothetical protein
VLAATDPRRIAVEGSSAGDSFRTNECVDNVLVTAADTGPGMGPRHPLRPRPRPQGSATIAYLRRLPPPSARHPHDGHP